MPQTSVTFKQFVSILRALKERAWVDGRVKGLLQIEDQEQLELLRLLFSEELASDFPATLDDGDVEDFAVGYEVKARFGRPRVSLGYLFPDAQALVGNVALLLGQATSKDWYLCEEDTASWEAEKDLPRRLCFVRNLVEHLESTAAIFDARKNILVFLRDGRFDVPIKLHADAALSLDIEVAQKLIDALDRDDGHASQRQEICATALIDLVSDKPENERFSYLLHHVDELNIRFQAGYRLFASSFSFEKIREQAQAIKVEYTGKIHKALSDIQGQLLGIPISTIVVATQFKEVGATPGQVWINIAVFVGATIFCALLSIAIWNQYHTLSVLYDDLARQWAALRKENKEVADRLHSIFDKLNNRIIGHHIALVVIGGIAFFAWLVGLAVFWMLTSSAFG